MSNHKRKRKLAKNHLTKLLLIKWINLVSLISQLQFTHHLERNRKRWQLRRQKKFRRVSLERMRRRKKHCRKEVMKMEEQHKRKSRIWWLMMLLLNCSKQIKGNKRALQNQYRKFENLQFQRKFKTHQYKWSFKTQ